MATRASARSGGQMRGDSFEIFKRPEHSLPVRIAGLIVRARAELLVLAVLVGLARAVVWVVQERGVSAWTVGLSIAVPAVGLMFWSAARLYLVQRGWAVLTRHRLRKVFVECRVMTFSGYLPLLFWSRPSAVGERVWVFLRAGIDLHDVEVRLPHIAVGCLAQDARVTAHRRLAALVVIEVVRRDPLSGKPVSSPMTAPAAGSKGKPNLRVVPAIGGERSA